MKKEIIIQLALLGAALLLMFATVLSKRSETPVELPDEQLLTLLEDGERRGEGAEEESWGGFSPSQGPGDGSAATETVY